MGPWDLALDYDYWTYGMGETLPVAFDAIANVLLADIMSAIIPEQDRHEVPQGFTQVGHVCRFYPTRALRTCTKLTWS